MTADASRARCLARLVSLAIVPTAMFVVLHAQAPVIPPVVPLPTFHASVDVVQLDVTVLDTQREPVSGLTASDFSVLEDGTPRPIVAFSVMEAPEASPNAAPWTRTVPLDVTTNELATHRIMVIVLDDRLIPAGMTGAAAAVATRAIDRLGPGDLGAVLFTGYGRNQNLTTDHAALHKAVASLSPHAPVGLNFGKADPGMIGRIAGILQNGPVGRKILLSISPAPNMGLLLTDGTGLQNVRRELQAANITVYTFDLRGVQTHSPVGEWGGTPRVGFGSAIVAPIFQGPNPNDLSMLTGGRATVGTNDPWDGLENVYRESRLYYLIGFERGAPADGQLHKVSVSVNRPGLDVRTRTSYAAPDASMAQPAASERVGPSADPVDAALGRGLPGGDMPLRVVVTPVAAREARHTILIVGTEIGAVPGADAATSTRRVDLVATALDKDWNPRATERQTVDLSQTDGATAHEVLSRLSLAPGRYEVRVATESAGHTGNVFVDVDVPDLGGPALALSGVILSQEPGVPAGPRDALADLVPVAPATTRTFSRADHVTAFVRVYQGRSGRLQAATVTTRILNDRNDRVFEHVSPIAVGAFGSDRSADVTLDLPLGQLPRGDYVLSIAVGNGDRGSLATSDSR